MIFHIPGLPHTQTNKSFLSCAYSQKVLKLCGMLTEAGHTVYHYGCEGSEVECTEHFTVCTDKIRRSAYPTNDDRTKPYQFSNEQFNSHWNTMCAVKIRANIKGPGEFLLCAWGFGHKPIADMVGDCAIAVESGIGYIGTFARFRVFESAFHQAWTYGKEGREDGKWADDTVIPNFFDPADFEYRDFNKGEYLLYLGRIVKRKGVELASDIAKATGHKLVIAGQGKLTDEGMGLSGDHIEFVGYADVEKRRELLAGAKALICPTYYLEPFGGVAVEAAMSGTPVICTDWGGFRETVVEGVTGFRCTTFAEFCRAVERIERIQPEECREWAEAHYSCDAITPQYEHYFTRILACGAVLPGMDWYSR